MTDQKQPSQREKIKKRSNRASARTASRTPSAMLVSDPSDPLIPFQVYKMRRSVKEGVEKAAARRGWSAAALVREVLGVFVAQEEARDKARENARREQTGTAGAAAPATKV